MTVETGFVGDCACARNWRIVSVDAQGFYVADVAPISFQFQSNFNSPGQGTLTFSRYEGSLDEAPQVPYQLAEAIRPMRYVYPRNRILYFMRTTGQGATPQEPVVMFAGLVETLDTDLTGVVTVGFNEYDIRLNYGIINLDRTFVQEPQTDIAEDISNLAMKADTGLDNSGIYARSFPGSPAVLRDRTYIGSEYKNGREMVDNLLNVINGPSYRLSYEFIPADQRWIAYIDYYDELPQTETPVITDRDVSDFKLNLDSNEQFSRIYALGAPSDEPGQEQPEYISDLSLAGFIDTEQVVTWDTVTTPEVLEENAEGWLDIHADVAGGATFSLRGLDFPQLQALQPGNVLDLRVRGTGLGLVSTQFHIDTVSVSVAQEGPETITVKASSIRITDDVFLFGGDPATGCVNCEGR